LAGEPATRTFSLVAGVTELLDHLNGRLRLGIVTTRSRDEVQAFLEQFSLQGRSAPSSAATMWPI